MNKNKSPMRSMFSSVFKREDITLISKSNKSFALKENFQKYPSGLLHPARSATPTPVQTYQSEILSSRSNAESVRYEELLKQYERMQEFYKAQISSMSEEVEHYKDLYFKVMKYKNLNNY